MGTCARANFLSFETYDRIHPKLIIFSLINFKVHFFPASGLWKNQRKKEEQWELCSEIYRQHFENLLTVKHRLSSSPCYHFCGSPARFVHSLHSWDFSWSYWGSAWGTRAGFFRPVKSLAVQAEELNSAPRALLLCAYQAPLSTTWIQ